MPYDAQMENFLAPYRKNRRCLVVLNLPFTKNRTEIDQDIKANGQNVEAVIWPNTEDDPKTSAPRHKGHAFVIFGDRTSCATTLRLLLEFKYEGRDLAVKMASRWATTPDPTGARRAADPNYVASNDPHPLPAAPSTLAASHGLAGPSVASPAPSLVGPEIALLNAKSARQQREIDELTVANKFLEERLDRLERLVARLNTARVPNISVDNSGDNQMTGQN